MKKQLIVIFLVLSLISAGFTGCSKEAETSTEPQTASEAETTPTATVEEAATTEEAATGEDTAAEPDYSSLKAAILLPGSANDGSFNQKGYNALMDLKNLGCEVQYSENVAAADQLQALREYAGMGYNIIIGWGSQFDDDMKTVAEEYPDIQFVIGSGTVGNDTNLTSIYVSGAHLGYGYGYLAALVSKTGKVAFIGANQGNQAYTDEVCGFIEGAKAANPDAEVTILYVTDYSDVAEAKESAKLCVEKGCDVIFGDISEGYYGILDVVTANNLYTFGRNADNVASYPAGIITYINNNWGIKLQDVAKHYLTEGMLTGVTEVGFGTVVSGWTYNYDDSNEFNPDLVTPELAEKFKTDVVDKITKNGYEHNYTAEDANPGTY
jgi:basic membrane protein A and related proteins